MIQVHKMAEEQYTNEDAEDAHKRSLLYPTEIKETPKPSKSVEKSEEKPKKKAKR